METINIFEHNDNNIKDELILKLDKDTNIRIYNTNLKYINLTIHDNINVDINDLNLISNGNKKIIFNIYSNSTLTYNLSNITNFNYNLDITINFLGKKSKLETNIHSIVSSNEIIKIDGVVNNSNKENELLENVKVILIDNGKCEVIPNMLIETNNVIANHKVAISNVRNNELFYLMSKGLSENSSIKLIKKSFLISNIKDSELKNKLNNI